LRKAWRGFLSFWRGLRPRALWEYSSAFKDVFWEVFWGATMMGILFGFYTLFEAPSVPPLFLSYVALVVFFAGYAMWKPLHERLSPRLVLLKPTTHRTPTHLPSVQKIFVQVPIRCSTESAVTECRGQLLRIFHRFNDEWQLTSFDQTADLLWSVVDEPVASIEPGADRRLNVVSFTSEHQVMLACTKSLPLAMILPILGGEVYRCDIRIGSKECVPVFKSIIVSTGSQWNEIVVDESDTEGI
jgi:hypothetical protein